ncbi:hypothetical protein CEXT_80101 [Caerostris extrusa]|uniref:Uncharacterized protein n=1 Tax=Caerostris extrusa TaxID=172846 RepID=A0AAV4SX53_CAEEX|nr:hypothetical protein CEXT_80101 [Caerostris extrusa]
MNNRLSAERYFSYSDSSGRKHQELHSVLREPFFFIHRPVYFSSQRVPPGLIDDLTRFWVRPGVKKILSRKLTMNIMMGNRQVHDGKTFPSRKTLKCNRGAICLPHEETYIMDIEYLYKIQ